MPVSRCSSRRAIRWNRRIINASGWRAMSLQGTNITLKTALLALGLLLGTAIAAATEDRNQELVAAVPENFPPYYLLDGSGRPTGFAIETMTRIAETAGLRVRYLVKPDWESTMAALRQGEADLIPNLGITPGRLDHFAFTAPLETFGLGLFVRSVNAGVHDMNDLEGKTAAVVNGNVAVKWLQDYPQVTSRGFEHQEQALFALLSGEVDAFIYPITVTWKMAADIGVDGLVRQAGLPLMEIKRAVAVRKEERELLERLDKAVRTYTSGEQFGATYARWHTRPTLFWTPERVVRYGSMLIVLVLSVGVLALLWWRHHSIAKLQQQLQESQMALERCRQEKSEQEEPR